MSGARCEAATEGPWRWADWQQDGGSDQFTLEAPPQTVHGWKASDGSVFGDMVADIPNDIITDEEMEISLADRDFIAHAREDIPALLAEVERLREVVSRNALRKAGA